MNWINSMLWQEMRTLVDRATPLTDVLKKHGADLRKKRAFYVVEANLERGKTIKYGIAGVEKGNAYGRMREYQLLYGTETKKNDCLGVKVHYLGTTAYNSQVEPKKTEVAKVEASIKKQVKSRTMSSEATGLNRGFERTDAVNRRKIVNIAKSREFKDGAVSTANSHGTQTRAKTSRQRSVALNPPKIKS